MATPISQATRFHPSPPFPLQENAQPGDEQMMVASAMEEQMRTSDIENDMFSKGNADRSSRRHVQMKQATTF